jgi:pimeloyl-ACP methyl ester carboxylesterase
MIAYGTCDAVIPISQAEQAANGIPNAILRKVEGASHLIVFHKDGHQLRKE